MLSLAFFLQFHNFIFFPFGFGWFLWVFQCCFIVLVVPFFVFCFLFLRRAVIPWVFEMFKMVFLRKTGKNQKHELPMIIQYNIMNKHEKSTCFLCLSLPFKPKAGQKRLGSPTGTLRHPPQDAKRFSSPNAWEAFRWEAPSDFQIQTLYIPKSFSRNMSSLRATKAACGRRPREGARYGRPP